MNEERINQIKEQIRELMRQITSIGEEPPEFIQDLLLQVLEKAQRQIQELRQQDQAGFTINGPPEPPIEPGMPSSNVEGFAYDDKTGRLLVRFLGQHPNRNGPIYAYSGVPKQIFDLFQKGAVPARTDGKNKWGRWWKGKVPSLGASLYTLIKTQNYPYQRMS